MVNPRKVVVIGDGNVGSSIAFALVLKKKISELVIIDVNKDKAEGDALDMAHAMSINGPLVVKAAGYSEISDARIIIITAGAAQKPGETRIDLLNKNKAIFDSIFKNMKPYLSQESIVLVVTNPVDVLTMYTYDQLNLPANQVIGSGTVLDTGRLKYLLSRDTGIDPRNIHAYIIGEHGDSELAAYSVTSIGGVSMEDYCKKCGRCRGRQNERLDLIEEEVVNSAYEIIAKKGSTYYGIAVATSRIVDAILEDSRSILTVSSYISNGLDGQIDGVYLSVPTIVSHLGAEKTIWPNYSEEEKQSLIESANKLKALNG